MSHVQVAEAGLPRAASLPGQQHSSQRRARAATLHIPIPIATADSPTLTPRNALASTIHFERATAAPRSPRVFISTGNAEQDKQELQRANVVSTVAGLALLKSKPSQDPAEQKRRGQIEFVPPSELPEEIRKEKQAAIRNWRRQKRQQEAAAIIEQVSKQGMPKSVLEATSNLSTIVKVVATDIDNSDSGSDSDEKIEKAAHMLPIDVKHTDRESHRDVPTRASSGAGGAKSSLVSLMTDTVGDKKKTRQHFSLEILETHDITSNEEFETIDGDDNTSVQSDTPRSQMSNTATSSSTTTTISPADDADEDKNERLEKRKRSILMQQLMCGATCQYNFLQIYDTIWYGLNETLREQFWTSQLQNQSEAATEESDFVSFEDIITNGTMKLNCYEAIMKDVYRTFCYVLRFRPDFDKLLYQVLVAYAIYRPDIGFMQGMPYVLGTIVLTLPRQEQQLRLMEHITRRVLPFYFDTDGVGWRVDANVIVAYMADRSKPYLKFYEEHLKEPFYEVAILISSRWFTTLFVNILRGSQVLRIWDMIMLRGAVTLIQFTLQIFQYAYKHELFIDAETPAHFLLIIEKKLASMNSIDSILRTGLDGKHIPVEDFELRRRTATRVEFMKLKKTAEAVMSETKKLTAND